MLYTSDVEITDLVQSTFAHVGSNKYAETVSWKWNTRFRVCLGRAYFDMMQLEFSTYLWRMAKPEERINTVIHEACHLAADKLYEHQEHGEPWQYLMLLCGVQPEEEHRVGYDDQRKPVFCRCIGGQRIGKIRYGRIQTGQANYTCSQCGDTVRLVK